MSRYQKINKNRSSSLLNTLYRSKTSMQAYKDCRESEII